MTLHLHAEYIWGIAGLICFLASGVVLYKALRITGETIARRAIVSRRNEACREAFALAQYGAWEEAIDILGREDEILVQEHPRGLIAELMFDEDVISFIEGTHAPGKKGVRS